MNEIEWLKKYLYYEQLDESQLTHIYRFTLIWNIFEAKCCHNNAQIAQSVTLANAVESDFKEVILNNIWNYFYQRYILNDKRTQPFTSFKFKLNDKKSFVENALIQNDSTSKRDKLEALLRIIFRLRNNLYHGDKEVEKLYKQNKNFEMANTFLMELIEVKTNRRIS